MKSLNFVSTLLLIVLTTFTSCSKQAPPCPNGNAAWVNGRWECPPCPYGEWDPMARNGRGDWWCPDNGGGNGPVNPGPTNDGSSFGYGFVVGDIYILTAVTKATTDQAAAVNFNYQEDCTWDGIYKSNGTFEKNTDYQLVPGFKCIGSTYRPFNGSQQKVWVFVQDLVLVERKYMENYAVSQSYIALGYDIPYIAISPRTYNPSTPIDVMVANESTSTMQVLPGHGVATEYEVPVGFKSTGLSVNSNLCNITNGAYWQIEGRPTVLTKRVQ